jgi:ferredoxin
LTKTDSFLGTFAIDPFTCNDCGLCVATCPEGAIVADPAWPVCHDRGCPLHSRRLGEYQCALWRDRCATCGTTLWTTPEGREACPRCELGMKVSCPKAHHLVPVTAPSLRVRTQPAPVEP